jgi:UDPglucose 6-dehydrogenase
MTITVVGHGYVGLVSACVFADLGNTVYVIGHTEEKLERLRSGDPIIYEPGLKEILVKNNQAKRLHFVSDYKESIPQSDIVFITVGTPPKDNGEADLSTVFTVAEQIGTSLKNGYTVVSCKSTVPVGTNIKVQEIINKVKPEGATFDVASCPEFLREGSALQDTFHPDRIVIGSDSKKATDILLELHKPLDGKRVLVNLSSAELIKYAANSILATKISFANLIAFISEKAGADVEQVLDGVGMDKRIGRIFFSPGAGYGGSCFPKDVKALIQTGQSLGVDMSLLKGVEEVNEQAKENIYQKIITHAKGKTIGIWGLAFKPDTDDIRFAPSQYIIKKLLENQYTIKTYDPEASGNIKKIFGESISYCANAYEAASDTDALVLLTEWNEFKQIDLKKVSQSMNTPLMIDGRNIYTQEQMSSVGIEYISVGR